METIRNGYKQTDIGIIPEDWEVKTIGKIFTSFPTASFSREQLGDGNVKYIHYGDIHTKFGTIVYVDTADLPTVSDSQSNRYVKLKNGDIILADASEDYEGVGKCIEILNCQNTPAISGLHTIPLRDSNNEFVDGLRGYIFQSKRVKSQLDRQAVGTKVYSISYNSIKECLVPIPTKIEQLAIAEVLSDIDSLIEVLDKKIAKKRAIKDGAMQQLLTAKKRLPGFSDPWTENELKTDLYFQPGYPFESSFFNTEINGIRLIRNRDLKSDDQVIYYSGIELEMYIVNNGDLLVSMDGDFSPIIWTKGRALLNQRVGRVRSKGQWHLRYFYYALIKPLQAIEDVVGATTVKHLSHNDVETIRLCIPSSKKEQQAIAQILIDMDAEIELLEQQRSKYIALKQGAMQQLLTGQIRLM